MPSVTPTLIPAFAPSLKPLLSSSDGDVVVAAGACAVVVWLVLVLGNMVAGCHFRSRR